MAGISNRLLPVPSASSVFSVVKAFLLQRLTTEPTECTEKHGNIRAEEKKESRTLSTF